MKRPNKVTIQNKRQKKCYNAKEKTKKCDNANEIMKRQKTKYQQQEKTYGWQILLEIN